MLSDKRGKEIPFRKISGFTDIGKPWQEKSLRVIYYHDGKTGQTSAVAQPWRNRLEILWNIVWAHLAASLLVLPLMVLLLHLAVKRSIYPLKELASELSERRADNLAPVSRAVPQETQTLVDALNRLFARVQTNIEREQRFTSDAAHELRSPLAALKVQTEVLALSDTAEQPYHLQQIQQSLNRAEHLINQLLTLARLDPEQGLKNTAPINWESLSSQVLQNTNLSARENASASSANFLPSRPSCKATTRYCNSCCATCSTTLCAIRPKTARLDCIFTLTVSKYATKAPASPPNTCRGLKNVSTVLPDKIPKAADWVCPSPNTSPNSTA